MLLVLESSPHPAKHRHLITIVTPFSSSLESSDLHWLQKLAQINCRDSSPIMASILSYIPLVNRLVGSSSSERIFGIPPPEQHDVEADTDKRLRCLKHLLKANHVNYAIIYNNLRFDNHNAHILCSAYLLGASDDQLRDIYDKEVQTLEPWTQSPCEIIEEDWTEYLGDRRYQRAYIDFFEDQVVHSFSYDWKKLLEHYMFHDKNRLVYGLFGGRK